MAQKNAIDAYKINDKNNIKICHCSAALGTVPPHFPEDAAKNAVDAGQGSQKLKKRLRPYPVRWQNEEQHHH